MLPAEINKIINIPDNQSKVPVKIIDAEFIYNFLIKNNLKKTLETGFAHGRSAAYIIAATNSMHIANDAFQEAEFKNVGLENIKRLGLIDLLDFRNELSHVMLPKLLADNRTFEFIFLDGDHKFDGEFIDFFYCDLMLEDKGYILLHDTWLRSTQYLIKYIEKNRKNYKRIQTPIKNICLFQKIGEYERNWLHFKEFITFRSFIKFHFVTWINNNNKNPIRILLFKLKNIIKGNK